jgi:hypothetical protein
MWDSTYEGVLRIGDWLFFHFSVSPEQAFKRTLLLELDTSASPHAQPILLLRRNLIPALQDGFLPTLDAFAYDYADEHGFEYLKGLRQTIIVPKAELSAGDYYVGVYNIWGQTGLDEESHDEADECSAHMH